MELPIPARTDSLTAWLTYIESLDVKPINLGLERMKTMIERLGIRFKAPVFTVAGTNGKGSTCAMLESILRSAGYRVGLHTSPHLIRFNERALIDGKEVKDEVIVEALAQVQEKRKELILSYFEFTGLAILKIFSDAALDAVILEIGLGGRLDGMNAIDTSCGIVCALGIDHVAYLGNTREKIALEKAGIYRSGRPAICTDRTIPSTLVDYARQIGAPLSLYGREFETRVGRDEFDFTYGLADDLIALKGLPRPALMGENQIQNAAGVLAALCAMRKELPVTREAIEQGLKTVYLKARFEKVPLRLTHNIPVILDVGHNPQAASILARNMALTQEKGVATWAVFGMLKDKDMQQVAFLMKNSVQKWFIASLTGPRAATAEELKEKMLLAGIENQAIESFESIPTALDRAINLALQELPGTVRILTFGSFVTVSAALNALNFQ